MPVLVIKDLSGDYCFQLITDECWDQITANSKGTIAETDVHKWAETVDRTIGDRDDRKSDFKKNVIAEYFVQDYVPEATPKFKDHIIKKVVFIP